MLRIAPGADHSPRAGPKQLFLVAWGRFNAPGAIRLLPFNPCHPWWTPGFL